MKGLWSCKEPCVAFVFSISDLTVILQPFLDKVSGEPQEIVVNRRNVFGSFCRAISCPEFSFRRPLIVVFAGEDGEDEGGLRREFFR